MTKTCWAKGQTGKINLWLFNQKSPKISQNSEKKFQNLEKVRKSQKSLTEFSYLFALRAESHPSLFSIRRVKEKEISQVILDYFHEKDLFLRIKGLKLSIVIFMFMVSFHVVSWYTFRCDPRLETLQIFSYKFQNSNLNLFKMFICQSFFFNNYRNKQIILIKTWVSESSGLTCFRKFSPSLKFKKKRNPPGYMKLTNVPKNLWFTPKSFSKVYRRFSPLGVWRNSVWPGSWLMIFK